MTFHLKEKNGRTSEMLKDYKDIFLIISNSIECAKQSL